MAFDPGVGLIDTGLNLGLRHGIDCDHISAIPDERSKTPQCGHASPSGNAASTTSSHGLFSTRSTLRPARPSRLLISSSMGG